MAGQTFKQARAAAWARFDHLVETAVRGWLVVQNPKTTSVRHLVPRDFANTYGRLAYIGTQVWAVDVRAACGEWFEQMQPTDELTSAHGKPREWCEGCIAAVLAECDAVVEYGKAHNAQLAVLFQSAHGCSAMHAESARERVGRMVASVAEAQAERRATALRLWQERAARIEDARAEAEEQARATADLYAIVGRSGTDE